MFKVNLIHAKSWCIRHLKVLQRNCTHVKNDIWIFEGDELFLRDAGIDFDILDKGIVPALGDLTETEVINLCKETFNFNHKLLE